MGRIQPGVIRRSDVMRIMTCGRAAENSSFPFFFFCFLSRPSRRPTKIKEKNNFDFRWALPIFLSLARGRFGVRLLYNQIKESSRWNKRRRWRQVENIFFSDAWFRQQPFSRVRLVLPIVAASRKRWTFGNMMDFFECIYLRNGALCIPKNSECHSGSHTEKLNAHKHRLSVFVFSPTLSSSRQQSHRALRRRCWQLCSYITTHRPL